MIDYRILPVTPAEYETIRQIAHNTWPDTFGDILSGAQIDYMLGMMYSLEAIEAQVAKGHVFHLLLERQSGNQQPSPNLQYPKAKTVRFKPVGYVSHQLDYLPGTTKIHKLYALPSVQGRGYGKAMTHKIETIARAAGQQTLRLDVNYENKAVGFYEYLGFEKVGRFDTDIGHGYLMEDWIMEKAL
ncbi:GNAT family N-acetyltransferase [Neolewinella persica]|uniref:GNAT family N-acetyltransferase n=1 Tax=Neolewinella persica TaxID=70998 RepID=UPI0003815553|nr:GNAT family N-acetyltransferase [Neolewinella persica]